MPLNVKAPLRTQPRTLPAVVSTTGLEAVAITVPPRGPPASDFEDSFVPASLAAAGLPTRDAPPAAPSPAAAWSRRRRSGEVGPGGFEIRVLCSIRPPA